MKKAIIPIMAAMALAAPCANAMHGEEIKVSVVVNGQAVEFEDQQPVIIGGRTLLPVRGVMEALGKTVTWDENEHRAVITDGSTTISLGIGDSIMRKKTAEGEYEVQLDTVPMIINDRTCLPIRAAAEAFGAEVDWNDAVKTVIISN